jgi:hypothetical protein
MTTRLSFLAALTFCLPLSAIFTLPASAAAPGKVPAYLEAKDWLIACDNARRCDARGFSDDHQGTEMIITRDAGPNAWPRIVLESMGPLPPDNATLDGKPFALPKTVKSGVFDKDTPGSDTLAVDGQAAVDLLKQLRNGTKLSFGAPKGDTDPSVSLSGLAAVMLTMDDVQGRIGTETAVARPGTAKAAGVPPAPPLPTAGKGAPPPAKPFSGAEAAALVKALRNSPLMKQADCDGGIDKPEDSASKLTDHLGVVMLECLRGAYQSSDLVLLVTDGKASTAKQLTLPVPLQKDPVDLFGNAAFDAGTATLSTSAKGRGLADCGMSASWIFDGKGFVLQSYNRQDKCGGIEPGDWPVLLRVAGALR